MSYGVNLQFFVRESGFENVVAFDKLPDQVQKACALKLMEIDKGYLAEVLPGADFFHVSEWQNYCEAFLRCPVGAAMILIGKVGHAKTNEELSDADINGSLESEALIHKNIKLTVEQLETLSPLVISELLLQAAMRYMVPIAQKHFDDAAPTMRLGS